MVELYPWHSTSWHAARLDITNCRNVLASFVWTPLSELSVTDVFAFGKSWATVAQQLEFKLVKRWPAGTFSVMSRQGMVFELPDANQRLVVVWQLGYAGPPAGADVDRLKDLLDEL